MASTDPGRNDGNVGDCFLKCLGFLLAVAVSPLPGHTSSESEDRLNLDQTIPRKLLLKRDGPRYRNYAHQPFSNYANHTFPYEDAPRTYYGPLGNKLITGYDFYTWVEQRMPGLRCDGRPGDQCGSFLEIEGGGSGAMVVGRDGYGSWGYTFVVGTTSRNRFTPLTVSRSGPDGTRLDISTPHLKTSTLFSRQWQHRGKGQFMLLNRAQIELGAITLGLNWCNWHHYDSVELGNSSKGRLVTDDHGYIQHRWNYSELRKVSWIFIRFSDDSPDDGVGGPIVHGARIMVNGQHRPDLQPVVIRHRIGEATSVGRLSQADGTFRPVSYATGRNASPYADYFYRIDHERRIDVSENANVEGLVRKFVLESPDRVLHAGRDEGLVYLFDLSREPDVLSVQVETLVGNDYRIEESVVFDVNPRARDYVGRYSADSFETLVRATGNIRDGSNLKKIRFQVGGMWTGQFVYGADFNLALRGVEINAEYARTSIYRRYPAVIDGEPAFNHGPRIRGGDSAYFINATRWFELGRLGAEFFAMNPDFVNDTIDDNDDGDILPDMFERPWNGVYVRQDEDNDGLPDINRDGDALPDYVEPFLMYDVEPNEFEYGLDRNNNDEPDFREDDLERDYPYDPDQRGYHFFGQLDLSRHLSLAAGHYAGAQIAGEGLNETSYTLLTYRREGTRGLRRLLFENGLRRVRDDIKDDYMVFAEDRLFKGLRPRHTVFTFLSTLREDPLAYMDSRVNETNLEVWLRPWSTLNVVQKLRLRLNWQQGKSPRGDRRDREGLQDYRTSVSRVDFTWNRGRLKLQPKFKLMVLSSADRKRNQTTRYEIDAIPILQVNYEVLRRTVLRVGVQGWGPLPYRFEDRTRELASFERRTTLASITTNSPYRGYKLYTIIGFQKDAMKFDADFRKPQNNDYWSFFVRALVGFAGYGNPI